jgi:hypothetical protein
MPRPNGYAIRDWIADDRRFLEEDRRYFAALPLIRFGVF